MLLVSHSLVRQAVSDLSKFQSLCEEVIDLDHLRESGGKQVRVRPSFHAELQRLGQELAGTSEEMAGVLKDVEKSSKVCVTPSSNTTRAARWVEVFLTSQVVVVLTAACLQSDCSPMPACIWMSCATPT